VLTTGILYSRFVKVRWNYHLHIRSEGSGFWGLTKNTLDQVKVFKETLNIPKLVGTACRKQDKFIADGYIIPEVGKPPMTRQDYSFGNWGLQNNEQQDLNSGTKILSIGRLQVK